MRRRRRLERGPAWPCPGTPREGRSTQGSGRAGPVAPSVLAGAERVRATVSRPAEGRSVPGPAGDAAQHLREAAKTCAPTAAWRC